MMGSYFGGWGFGWIFMLAFWGLVIWAIFALVQSVSGGGCCGRKHGEQGAGKSSALDMLKERYAKGEISKEEFDKVKKDLE